MVMTACVSYWILLDYLASQSNGFLADLTFQSRILTMENLWKRKRTVVNGPGTYGVWRMLRQLINSLKLYNWPCHLCLVWVQHGVSRHHQGPCLATISLRLGRISCIVYCCYMVNLEKIKQLLFQMESSEACDL